MSDFEILHQNNGIYRINVIGNFKDSDAEYLSEHLGKIYDANDPSYVSIDLSNYYVLPLRTLGLALLRFYRSSSEQSPTFIALIVQTSIAQVLGSMLKTLMSRELIQTFTYETAAEKWLMLEQKKRQNHSGIGR